MQLSEFGKSREHLIKAGKLSPGNEEIRQELQKLDRCVLYCCDPASLWGSFVISNDRVLAIPYSGLFLWGANFRYFRGQPTSHEIFHPRILRSVACAVQNRAD